MQAPTTTTEATPMMIPTRVSSDRSLWARIDERAMRSASTREVDSMADATPRTGAGSRRSEGQAGLDEQRALVAGELDGGADLHGLRRLAQGLLQGLERDLRALGAQEQEVHAAGQVGGRPG